MNRQSKKHMSSSFPDFAKIANLSLIEELYEKYKVDPKSVDDSWRHFFEGIDFGSYLYQRGKGGEKEGFDARIFELIENYRKLGHLKARCNPLQTQVPSAKELELESLGFFSEELDQEFFSYGFCGKEKASLKEIQNALEQIYSGPIGFEYVGSGPEIEKWIQSRIEPALHIDLAVEQKHLLLEYLNKAEVFESFLHTKYPGQTRFSLEGAETMIPLIAALIHHSKNLGVEEVFIGMAHRGRLNVLSNILNKPLEMIFAEFENDTTLSYEGNDDVRYHMGFSAKWDQVQLTLAPNPSHLEAVNPIVLGQTFAKQQILNDQKKAFPLLIHGDASIAGQGIIYECMQFMKLASYSVGGTIHLIVNNQIGYTTVANEGRSTRYASDIAKAFGAPVFHVNAEDPESVFFAAHLAIEIRQTFGVDVFLDLLCYRKYGHNEGDEPSFTQPLEYELIRSKKSIRTLYLEKLMQEGKLEQKMAEALEQTYKESLKNALARSSEKGSAPLLEEEKKENPFERVPTGVEESILHEVMKSFSSLPQEFHLHPKLEKWMGSRKEFAMKAIDWSTAECLAFGSLLKQKISIRLAGQDSQRGTFSQRHLILVDYQTGQKFCPLCELGSFQLVNSPLTEYAGMGFEYGISLIQQEALGLWEAQYGDFNNGAQIVIDLYIAGGERKWDCKSSLTLLLPHGYEGAGPEHSSARMERFLQLAATNNIRVVYPTMPSQYFHVLRRQALLKQKKPLIVLTPKGLLRNSLCTSELSALTSGAFEEFLEGPSPQQKPKRVLFCTGKIYFDLLTEKKRDDIGIIRIEQLYPFHEEKFKHLLEKYQEVQEWAWVQEEPQNMGAWKYIETILKQFVPHLHYVGRKESATTATGSNKKHKIEQANIIERAFGAM